MNMTYRPLNADRGGAMLSVYQGKLLQNGRSQFPVCKTRRFFRNRSFDRIWHLTTRISLHLSSTVGDLRITENVLTYTICVVRGGIFHYPYWYIFSQYALHRSRKWNLIILYKSAIYRNLVVIRTRVVIVYMLSMAYLPLLIVVGGAIRTFNIPRIWHIKHIL